jgi:hypothetical protein
MRPRVHPELVALLAAATISLLVGVVTSNAPARVERLVIHNETEFRLTVSVRGEDDWSETPIAYVWPSSTDVATEFPDPGATWIIDVRSELGSSAAVTVARDALVTADWTYRITPDVAILLRG